MPDNCDNPQLPFVRPAIVPFSEPCGPAVVQPADAAATLLTRLPDAKAPARPLLLIGSEAVSASCQDNSVGAFVELAAGFASREVDVETVSPDLAYAQLLWLQDNPAALALVAAAATLPELKLAYPVILEEQALPLLQAILEARAAATATALTAAQAALNCGWYNTAQTAACAENSVTPPAGVAAGSVFSRVSQEAANAAALNAARASLNCSWVNTAQTANCVADLGFATEVPTSGEQIGSSTIAAGLFTSTSGQVDADARAKAAAVAALNCFYTNDAGSLSCTNGAEISGPGGVLQVGNPVNFSAGLARSLVSAEDAQQAAEDIATGLLVCDFTSPAYVCPSIVYESQTYQPRSGLGVVIPAGAIIVATSQNEMEALFDALVLALAPCEYCNKAFPAKCAIGESIDATNAVAADSFCASTPALAFQQAQALNAIPTRQIEAGGTEVGCRYASAAVIALCNVAGFTPPAGTLLVYPHGGLPLVDPVSGNSVARSDVAAGAVLAESQVAADNAAKTAALALLNCFYENAAIDFTCATLDVPKLNVSSNSTDNVEVSAGMFTSYTAQSEADALSQAYGLALLNCFYESTTVHVYCGDTLGSLNSQMNESPETGSVILGNSLALLDGINTVAAKSTGSPSRPVTVQARAISSYASQNSANLVAVNLALTALNCFYESVVKTFTCATDLSKSGVASSISIDNQEVAAGTFTSFKTLEEANRIRDVFGKSLLTCLYANISKTHSRCPEASPPMELLSVGNVPAGMITSNVSQSAADNIATTLSEALVVCATQDQLGKGCPPDTDGNPQVRDDNGDCQPIMGCDKDARFGSVEINSLYLPCSTAKTVELTEDGFWFSAMGMDDKMTAQEFKVYNGTTMAVEDWYFLCGKKA
jgi:hypothetical protein